MFKSEIIYARRLARIAFGAVLVAGAAVMLARLGEPHLFAPFSNEPTATAHPQVAVVLILTWGAAFLVYAMVRVTVSRRGCAPQQLLVPSLVLPGIGMALLLPLTLHLPVAVLFDDVGDGFDHWAALSRDITAPAHVALALLVAWRAVRLARGQRGPSPAWIFSIVTIVSSIPWGILILPPILVMITGGPMVPLLAWMEPMVKSELAALGGDLPGASVVT